MADAAAVRILQNNMTYGGATEWEDPTFGKGFQAGYAAAIAALPLALDTLALEHGFMLVPRSMVTE